VPTGASTFTLYEQHCMLAHQQHPAQHLNSRVTRISSCTIGINRTTTKLSKMQWRSKRGRAASSGGLQVVVKKVARALMRKVANKQKKQHP